MEENINRVNIDFLDAFEDDYQQMMDLASICLEGVLVSTCFFPPFFTNFPNKQDLRLRNDYATRRAMQKGCG